MIRTILPVEQRGRRSWAGTGSWPTWWPVEDAVAGRVRLLLIAGEPGIGKTVLAQHLADHAARRGARVLWVRCWEAGGAPPFGRGRRCSRSSPRASTTRPWPPGWARGRSRSPSWCPAWARLGTTALPRAPRGSPMRRASLYEAVTGFLRAAAAEQPLLLVLEDLQAADASSLLLEFLARDLRGGRLLLVGTYRDLTADRVHGAGTTMSQLVREGHLLGLRGLDRGEVRGLVEALSGVEPSEAMVAAVHEATEGNPLFVRETVRLLGADVTLKDPGRLRVPLSGSVRTAIGRRLAPLSADAVQVLSVAAVVGREFDLPLLGSACELPIERILAGLSEAVALDVVTEGEGAAGRYRFSHDLIREVLYERLPIPAQVDPHRRVGASIEASTAAAWTPMSPSSPTTSARPRPPARPPRRWPTPAAPVSAPWTCTPTRRPPPSTGGRCRPCGSSARTSRCAASCCCGSRGAGRGGTPPGGGGALPGGRGAEPAAGLERAAGTGGAGVRRPRPRGKGRSTGGWSRSCAKPWTRYRCPTAPCGPGCWPACRWS